MWRSCWNLSVTETNLFGACSTIEHNYKWIKIIMLKSVVGNYHGIKGIKKHFNNSNCL